MTNDVQAALALLRAHVGDLHQVGTVRTEALATRLDDALDVLDACQPAGAAVLAAGAGADLSQDHLSVADLARVIRDESKRHPPATDLDAGCYAIATAALDWLHDQPNPERTRYVLANAGWKETIRQLDEAQWQLATATTQREQCIADGQRMAGLLDEAERRGEQAEQQVRTLRDEAQVLWRDWEERRNEMGRIHERDRAELATLRVSHLRAVEALSGALDEAHAILGSEDLAGAETIAHVHGYHYPAAFQARCRAAHAARTAALAAWKGPWA